MADAPETRGSFRQMRTPEWVVWIAIALAGLWFFDRAWPNAAVRLVTWNAAFALSAVYWVNGTSILMYAFGAFQPGVLVCCASVMILLMLGVHPVLCAVGFFDTWSNFRRTVDRVIAARERGERMNNSEDDGDN